MTSATQLPPDNLTIMQSEFIRHLFNPELGGNVGKAAELAGYKHPKQAGNILTNNPNVIKAIEKRKEELRQSADIEAHWIVKQLKEAIDRTKATDETNHRGYIDLGLKYKRLIGDNSNNTQVNVVLSSPLSPSDERKQLENRLNLLNSKDNAGNGVL